MRPLSRLLVYILLALLLWLTDSLLLAFWQRLPLGLALWSGVEAWRLLARLLTTVVLLLLGFGGYIGRAVREQEIIRMNKADNDRLFGNLDSPQRSRRLLYHAMRLATMMRMRPRKREELRLLCYCYQIGLVGVPLALLEKEGRLTAEEQRQRDRHLEVGRQIAANIPQLRRIAPLIACHEENYDGSGPQSMYGRSIPLACRIFLAVRIYDHLTLPRPQGQGMSREEALDELDLFSGAALDPEVVSAFRALLTDKMLSSAVGERIYAPS